MWCVVLVFGMLSAGALAASEDPYDVACAQLWTAIEEKTAMLETINATLEKEQAAYDALDAMLASGDYGGLKKGDIIKARQTIFSAMQHEVQGADALDKSIQKLNDSLTSLGWEPPVVPVAISWWTLDEGEGNAVHDSAGANHGTIYGASWVDGVIGTGLDFDGNRDYVVIPDNNDTLDFAEGQDFSVSLWFKIGQHGATEGPYLIGKRSTSGENRGYLFFYGDLSYQPYYEKLNFFVDPGQAVILTSTMNVNDGLWHHGVGQREGQTLRLYVDGVLEVEKTALEYAGDLANDNPFIFGMNHTLEFKDFYGSLDEIAVFGEALSEEAVQLLYEQGLD